MELTLSSVVGQSFTSTPRPLMLVTNGPLGYRACTPFTAAATHAQAASARRAPWRGMAAARQSLRMRMRRAKQTQLRRSRNAAQRTQLLCL
jgi:hypothetical protein